MLDFNLQTDQELLNWFIDREIKSLVENPDKELEHKKGYSEKLISVKNGKFLRVSGKNIIIPKYEEFTFFVWGDTFDCIRLTDESTGLGIVSEYKIREIAQSFYDIIKRAKNDFVLSDYIEKRYVHQKLLKAFYSDLKERQDYEAQKQGGKNTNE